jgi:hypothetical protein
MATLLIKGEIKNGDEKAGIRDIWNGLSQKIYKEKSSSENIIQLL